MRTFSAKEGCGTKIITLQLSPLTNHLSRASLCHRPKRSMPITCLLHLVSWRINFCFEDFSEQRTCQTPNYWHRLATLSLVYFMDLILSTQKMVRSYCCSNCRLDESRVGTQYRVFCALLNFGKNWNVSRFLLLQFAASYYKLLKRWFTLKFILHD